MQQCGLKSPQSLYHVRSYLGKLTVVLRVLAALATRIARGYVMLFPRTVWFDFRPRRHVVAPDIRSALVSSTALTHHHILQADIRCKKGIKVLVAMLAS